MPAAAGSIGAVEEHRVCGKGKYLFQGGVRLMHVHNSKAQAPAPAATRTAANSTPQPAAPPATQSIFKMS